MTFKGQKTPKKKSELPKLAEPETPKSFNSVRTRSKSVSRIESTKFDFEPKTPDKPSSSAVNRGFQSARSSMRARSLSRAASDEPKTPKRSAREVRSSISSEDEKTIQTSVSTRSKTLTKSQPSTEDLISTPRMTRKQTKMCNEKYELIVLDESPKKTPKKAPLTNRNSGLTPKLKELNIRLKKKEDKSDEYEIMKENNFVDENDENSQDSDADYAVEKKGRKTPKSVKKKSEPRTPSSVKRKLNVDQSATPKRLSLRRNLLLTPSMKERTLPVLKAATPLQEARKRLHVSAVPKSLPCREEEFNNIFSFLRSKILDESSGLVE